MDVGEELGNAAITSTGDSSGPMEATPSKSKGKGKEVEEYEWIDRVWGDLVFDGRDWRRLLTVDFGEGEGEGEGKARRKSRAISFAGGKASKPSKKKTLVPATIKIHANILKWFDSNPQSPTPEMVAATPTFRAVGRGHTHAAQNIKLSGSAPCARCKKSKTVRSLVLRLD